MFAIAAMSRGRVVGRGDAIPWRIPEELKWFRRTTLGRVLVMGRRTFESLPKPLDGRVIVVLTRDPERLARDAPLIERWADVPPAPELPALARLDAPRLPRTQVYVVRDLEPLARAGIADGACLCGGVQVYAQFLSACSDLYLSVIDRDVEGDAFFPPFEHAFDLARVVAEFPEFRVLHYVRNDVADRRAT